MTRRVRPLRALRLALRFGFDLTTSQEGEINEESLWRWSGFTDDEGARWSALWDRSTENSSGGRLGDALTWALEWQVHGFDYGDAVDWASSGAEPARLPVLAKMASARGFGAHDLEVWSEAGVPAEVGWIGLVDRLRSRGWTTEAVRLLALTTRAGQHPIAAQDLARCADVSVPVHLVLDGTRAGLSLGAAIDVAAATSAGVDSRALLDHLIHAQHFDEFVGAEINEAISDLDGDLANGHWSTPVPNDARVNASVRASLPREMWDVYPTLEGSPGSPDVVDLTGGLDGTWARERGEWDGHEPPEDLAVQPLLDWSDLHHACALRDYLATHARFLGAHDYVEMSWPPAGYLASEGSWSEGEAADCYEHGAVLSDGCPACEALAARGASRLFAVNHVKNAVWTWSVRVTTWSRREDSESDEVERHVVMRTEADPRTVRYSSSTSNGW